MSAGAGAVLADRRHGPLCERQVHRLAVRREQVDEVVAPGRAGGDRGIEHREPGDGGPVAPAPRAALHQERPVDPGEGAAQLVRGALADHGGERMPGRRVEPGERVFLDDPPERVAEAHGRARTPPVIGSRTPVVDGRVIGRPLSERTAR